MAWRSYATLFLLGLLLALGIAYYQAAPGYMDADYYFAGGRQIVGGQGFHVPFLWNYLEDTSGVWHPSHAYWMPLASLVAALGMWMGRTADFVAAQFPFLLIAASLPPLTASLSFSLTRRRDLAMTAGFLALLSGYYALVLTTTDTFGLYMILGVGFLWATRIPRPWLRALTLGLVAGLLHLARADGILWLGVAFLFVLIRSRHASRRSRAIVCSLLLLGYGVIMAPWMWRNLSAFGTPFAPSGWRMLWLTRYDQIFAYPVSQVTFHSWVRSGFGTILSVRLHALGHHFGTLVAVQGSVVLLPFMIWGAWTLRREERVWLGVLAWTITLFVMTVLFPFAGARGGFFHSGAAVQPLGWALAPLGLDRVVALTARRRGWVGKPARRVFQVGLVGAVLLLTAAISWPRLMGAPPRAQAWGRYASRYAAVEALLTAHGAHPSDVILVGNPPGYFVSTGRSAIAYPDGDARTVRAVARRYGAKYLILDAQSPPRALRALREPPRDRFLHLGTVRGEQVFSLPLEAN